MDITTLFIGFIVLGMILSLTQLSLRVSKIASSVFIVCDMIVLIKAIALVTVLYSKTQPGKSRSTVYRGTFYTDLHTKLVFGG